MRKLIYQALMAVSLLVLAGAKTTETAVTTEQSAGPIAMPLSGVIDGTSFLQGDNIIQLWGITSLPTDNPYALAAKLYLEVVLEQASFSCHYINKDQKNRYIMRCLTGNDDIGSLMVRRGLALDNPHHSRGAYKVDQKSAKEQKLGIWASNNSN